MRIIGFGDLNLEYYFKNHELIGICGSGISANIIANLSSSFETLFFGSLGKDLKGEIALESLTKLGVKVLPTYYEKTNINFFNRRTISEVCPYCHRLFKSEEHPINFNKIISNLCEDDILIVSSLDEETLSFLDKMNNRIFLNLSNVEDVDMYSLDELVDIFKDKFEVINISDKVYDFLKRKFMLDSFDFYELFNPEVLIIFRDYNGADIIYDGIFTKKEYEEKIIEEDISGGMEVFFSEFIKVYLTCELNEKMISKAFIKMSSLYNYVVRHTGARNNLEKLYKISDYKECICKEIFNN